MARRANEAGCCRSLISIVVLTLPHALNPLIERHQRRSTTCSLRAASQTLLAFGEKRFTGRSA